MNPGWYRAPTMVVCLWTVVMIVSNNPASVASQGTTLTLDIIPEKTDQPREGDSVTLECRVTSSDQPDVIFWQKSNLTSGEVTKFVDDEAGLNSNADARFSLSSITVANATGPVFSQRLMIQSIRESDETQYSCSTEAQTFDSKALRVFPADEFPICSPYGQVTVVNGSTLSCGTVKESKEPSVTISGMHFQAPGWAPRIGQSEGVELTHTVNISDNGTTFTCFATSRGSSMAFSCQIGPLTVINTNDLMDGGLTAADIAGIVIGCILILVLIALHFLCCRCTPQRWRRTKSYFLEIGSSSFGTSSNRPQGSAPDQLRDAELGNAQPASDSVPPSDASATRNKEAGAVRDSSPLEDTQESPAPSKSNTNALVDKPEQGINAYLDVNVTTPFVSNTNIKTKPVHVYDNVEVFQVGQANPDDLEARAHPKKMKRFDGKRKGKMDKPVSSDDVASDVKDSTELKKDPSVIYAKVNKTRTPAPDSVTTSEEPGVGKSPKKIKRFALRRKNKTPKPDPVIVYTEVDLPACQEGVRSPKEPRTQYAEIRY